MQNTMKVTTEYTSGTESRGSRIRVTWTDTTGRHSRLMPFEYAVRDQHRYAAMSALGLTARDGERLTQTESPNADTRTYSLAPTDYARAMADYERAVHAVTAAESSGDANALYAALGIRKAARAESMREFDAMGGYSS